MKRAALIIRWTQENNRHPLTAELETKVVTPIKVHVPKELIELSSGVKETMGSIPDLISKNS